MDDTKLITGVFLLVVVIAALTAHAGAITISSKDNVSIATKEAKDATTWNNLASGDLGSYTLSKVSSLKFILTSEKEKVEPVVQVWPGSDLIVSANYVGGDADIVQVGKDRIEGYYTYGKSSAYPWGIYWSIHDINGKPVLVYSEFSGKKTWYNPISQKTIDSLNAAIERGELPDISIVQAAVGA